MTQQPATPSDHFEQLASAARLYRKQHDDDCMCEGCIAYDDAVDEGPAIAPYTRPEYEPPR